MEEGVVLKIEDNLKGILGIDRVTSTSSENTAIITIETFKGFDTDVILADVKNAVDKVPSFPSGMEPARHCQKGGHPANHKLYSQW